MLRTLFIIATTLALAAPLFAQKTYPLRVDTTRARLNLTVVNGRLDLQAEINDNSGFLPITGIKLDDADLHIDYQLKGVDKGLTPRFIVHLIDATGMAYYPSVLRLKGDMPPAGSPLAPVVWLDITEKILLPGQSYELVIEKILMGPFDCDAPRPAFTIKQQLPHYAAAVAGLAAVGMGQVYRTQKEEAYDTYREFWSNENTKEEADVYLVRASDKEKSAKTATYVGIAILGFDALTYAYRQIQIRKKQRFFDKHCTQQGMSLQWQPYWEQTPNGSVTGAVGAGIRLTF